MDLKISKAIRNETASVFFTDYDVSKWSVNVAVRIVQESDIN